MRFVQLLLLLAAPAMGVMRGVAVHQSRPQVAMQRPRRQGTCAAAPRMAILDRITGKDKVEEGPSSAFYDPQQNAERVAAYMARVERINGMEDDIEELEDEALAAKTAELRRRLEQGASEDELLEEAFAVVREAAWRTLELRHYDVQLVGAMALNDGYLAQMGTGEGKTLVATGEVYLNALAGQGALVVTVNDYLARRDAETMGQVYSFLGLTVGLVQQGSTPAERRAAYAADVTYVTNSELGFDYLRDNLAGTAAEVVLRPKLNFCVVDEGDSVLIDEARVPLIISGKTDAPVDKYQVATKLAGALEVPEHYEVFEKEQTVSITEAGQKYCEQALQVADLYDPREPWASYVNNAIKAKALFVREKNYLVRDGEVLIVDEFSGRVMDGRRWGDGLHQAMEAKEGVEVQAETEVIASVTYQSLFSRFKRLCSMSGTALTEADELATIYQLPVLSVPPALDVQRQDVPSSVYKTVRGKSNAALNELMSMHKAGRPVLVGTTSVAASEAFSAKLKTLEVPHQVLNAKPETAQAESAIVAQAGRVGAVTISTNMAGRGTDILLGGNPGFMAKLWVRQACAAKAAIPLEPPPDGLYPTEPSAEALSLVEEAAAKFAQVATGAKDSEAAMLLLDEALAVASSLAAVDEGGLEDVAREAYEALVEDFEAVTQPEKEKVMQAGGLHVIGTNLHDSRRIDDQLRGRAGRQGDPGSTHFFLSLEDRIFRLFGGDKVKGLLDFLRVSEEQALESEQVAKAVADTQAGVERYYYELRKKLFEFDDVLASQREDTYATRASMVFADLPQAEGTLCAMAAAVVADIFRANWPADASAGGDLASTLDAKLRQFFPSLDVSAQALSGSRDEAESAAVAAATAAVGAKVAELEGVRPGLGVEAIRFLTLTQTDNLWKAHMKQMNFVKDFAGLKVYAQLNPLDVYREEGLTLYASMQTQLRQNTVFSFFQYQPRQ